MRVERCSLLARDDEPVTRSGRNISLATSHRYRCTSIDRVYRRTALQRIKWRVNSTTHESRARRLVAVMSTSRGRNEKNYRSDQYWSRHGERESGFVYCCCCRSRRSFFRRTYSTSAVFQEIINIWHSRETQQKRTEICSVKKRKDRQHRIDACQHGGIKVIVTKE